MYHIFMNFCIMLNFVFIVFKLIVVECNNKCSDIETDQFIVILIRILFCFIRKAIVLLTILHYNLKYTLLFGLLI